MKDLKYLLDLQLFADDNEKPEENVEDKVEEPEKPTDVEEPEDEEEQPSDDESSDKKQKSYVKIREEKARKALLKQLGVDNIDAAKTKLEESQKALDRVTQLEQKLEAERKSRETFLKRTQLIDALEEEKVFDSDALLHYVDLEKIELGQDEKIQDVPGIISQLKELKPKYFGKEFVKSDTYIKGTGEPSKPNGDYRSQTVEYLKAIKKK